MQKYHSMVLKSLMMQSKLADLYHFMGLKGYKRMHLYHYEKKSKILKKITSFHIDLYRKFMREVKPTEIEIVSENWMESESSSKNSVQIKNTIREAINTYSESMSLEMKCLSDDIEELRQKGDIAAVDFLNGYVEETRNEMVYINKIKQELIACDYSMEFILDSQQKIHDKFKKKK